MSVCAEFDRGEQSPLPLVGRAREQQLVESRLDAARAGAARALVLRGEPGIGKTGLCRHARDRADGFIVLDARGREAESELAFEALSELLQPILSNVTALPSAQAAVLESALRIGPELRAGAGDVGAAALSLLTEAAQHQPVLAIVDDAHALDAASAEALLYAARRLREGRIAILFAGRGARMGGFDLDGLDELKLRGIGAAAAQSLLAGAPYGEPPRAVLKRLVEEAGGNPLALIELPRALSEPQLRGLEPLPDPLPPGSAIKETFAPPLDVLDEASRRALALAAADGGEIGTIFRALEELGLGPKALEPAEEAGLIEIAGGTLRFRHPLTRSVAYHGSTASLRRESHAALAAALKRDPERRAWHLAASTVEPSEDVAAALEAAAKTARARASHLGAARANARAAQLSPAPSERGRRLGAAAIDAAHAGSLGWAARLLADALAETPERTLRIELQHLGGVTERLRGQIGQSCETLLGAAAEAESSDPSLASIIVAEAALSHACGGDLREAEALARRALSLAEANSEAGPIPGFVSATFETVLLLGGRPARVSTLKATVERMLRDSDLPPGCFPGLVPIAGALACEERFAEARTLLEGLAGQVRAAGKRGMLGPVLLALGETETRAGRWRPASDHLREAAALASEAGQAHVQAGALAGMAWIEAARGASDDCNDHLARALELAGDAPSLLIRVSAARGLLALGAGDAEAALSELEHARELAETSGLEHPLAVPFAADLVEAHCRANSVDGAMVALEELERAAERTGSNWALAAASRCRAMLAAPTEMEGHFQRALEAQGRGASAFDRARTELCLGERLRRERRRADARPHLRAALDGFEQLAAEPWAEKARKELGASVQSTQRAGLDLGALTPQELAVARIVARGAKNKEVAAELFVSKRTVDAHLNSVYRKLGLRSRTELAQALAAEPGGSTVSEPPPAANGIAATANGLPATNGADRLRVAIEAVRAVQLVADSDVAEHAEAVVKLCEAMCEPLGIEAEEREVLLHAASLHDIGRLAISREILDKPGPLTPEEWEEVMHHPVAGERILGAVPELRPVAQAVRHTHEHWDGSGYPDRIAKGRIPLASRVIFGADTFRTLRTERPHRAALGIEQTLAEIRSAAGTQFDPKVVDALEHAVAELRPDAGNGAAASLGVRSKAGPARPAARSDTPGNLASFLAQALLEPEHNEVGSS